MYENNVSHTTVTVTRSHPTDPIEHLCEMMELMKVLSIIIIILKTENEGVYFRGMSRVQTLGESMSGTIQTVIEACVLL